MPITSTLNRIPALIKWAVGIGLAIILLIAFFQFGGSFANGIGNWLFRRQINAKQAEVQKQLDDAAKQKQALEQTLLELKQTKEAYAAAKAEADAARQIFYDQSKTSSAKVAEFKEILADTPTHTDPTGVTTDDLCARAKASSASEYVTKALCGG